MKPGISLKDYSAESPCVLEPGDYILIVYLHNATDPALGEQACANDSSLKLSVSEKLKAGEVGNVCASFGYSQNWLQEEYKWCRCEVPITVCQDAKLAIESVSATKYGEGRVRLLEDNGSRYGHGISYRSGLSYRLEDFVGPIAPGYENSVIVTFQLSVK